MMLPGTAEVGPAEGPEGGDIHDVVTAPALTRRSRPGSSLAVLLGLVVAALVLPRLIIARPTTALLTLLVLATGVVVLTRLAVALALLVVVSPFESYLDLNVSPLLVKALGLVVFTAYGLRLLAGVERRAPRHAGMVALAAFLLLVLASTTAHPNGGDGLTTTVRYLSFGLLTLTLVSVMRVGGALRLLLGALVVSSTAASVFALQTFVSGASARANGPLDDPNDLAFVLAVSVPLAAALLAGASRWLRVVWLLCIVVLLAGVAFTLSRGAALALVVLLLWAVAQRLVPPAAAVAGAVALAVLVGGVAVSSPELVDRALTEKSRIGDRNVDTRALRWAAAVRMAVDNPLVGTGPSGFRLNYADYASVSRPDDATDVVAHQMYLEMAAELGLPALLAFLTLLGLAFRACRRSAGAPPGRGPPGDGVLALGVFGGLLVACTAALFLTEQYYLPLWMLAAAAFALELRLRDADEARA